MSYSTEELKAMDRRAKDKIIGALFEEIEEARARAFQFRGDAASAESRVDMLIARFRKLILTD